MGKYLLTLILAALISISFSASAAEAEKGIAASRLFGFFAPKLGAWSEYAVFNKASGKRTVMRMSIVDVEDDSFWYEVVSKEGDSTTVVKMLIKGDPVDSGNIRRLIMKTGTDPAREMSRDFFTTGRSMASYIFKQRSGISAVPGVHLKKNKTGDGTVTVPAGTFAVSLYDIVDDAGMVYGAYKFSRDVRPIGIVASDTANASVVLAGHGTGAQSLIREEVTMMSKPSEMQEGLGPGLKPTQGIKSDNGSVIRQIPGMGTGYEPRQ